MAESTVRNYRNELDTGAQIAHLSYSERRIGLDGKSYPATKRPAVSPFTPEPGPESEEPINELTGLEKGELLVERGEILSRIGLRRTVGGDGSNQHAPASNGGTVLPLQTTAQLAAGVGLSESSAQKRMQAARDIAPDVRDAIRDTPIANSTRTLLELARVQPAKPDRPAWLEKYFLPEVRSARRQWGNGR